MQKAIPPKLKSEVLSSAHLFAAAMREVFEAAVLRDVAGEKLTFMQLKLLYLVARTDGHTIGDAAGFLAVGYAAASKTVDKLVRLGLIVRTKMPEDRRATRLSVTEAGRRLIAAYETARHKLATNLFHQFSAQELRKTSELLDRLAVAIVSYSTNPDAVCLQCEVYYRANCRYGALSRRTCFYMRSKRSKRRAPGFGSNEV